MRRRTAKWSHPKLCEVPRTALRTTAELSTSNTIAPSSLRKAALSNKCSRTARCAAINSLAPVLSAQTGCRVDRHAMGIADPRVERPKALSSTTKLPDCEVGSAKFASE